MAVTVRWSWGQLVVLYAVDRGEERRSQSVGKLRAMQKKNAEAGPLLWEGQMTTLPVERQEQSRLQDVVRIPLRSCQDV